jgi:hypothetical protein
MRHAALSARERVLSSAGILAAEKGSVRARSLRFSSPGSFTRQCHAPWDFHSVPGRLSDLLVSALVSALIFFVFFSVVLEMRFALCFRAPEHGRTVGI